MRRHRRNHPLVVALYVNAALLLAILVAVMSGGRMPSVLSDAYAAPATPSPIAGGSGIYLMPGQLGEKNWGCYIMDVDAQTLCAYQYSPGDKKLRLVAAREFRHDRRLRNFNTDNPTPDEVADLVEMEKAGRRDKPADAANPAPDAGQPAEDGGQ